MKDWISTKLQQEKFSRKELVSFLFLSILTVRQWEKKKKYSSTTLDLTFLTDFSHLQYFIYHNSDNL